MDKSTDKNLCVPADYGKFDKTSNTYPEGTSPGLGKDYGKKNDTDLNNGFVPQVRKN